MDPSYKAKLCRLPKHLSKIIILWRASNGWLEKWKKRHNVKSYAICGESGNVDIDKAEEWKAFLASLCDGYTPANIFNMDETGYFYRDLPIQL